MFPVLKSGIRRYSHISAVAIYRFSWDSDSHRNVLHIYHNPYAERPVDTGVFHGVPQHIHNRDTDRMEWTDGFSLEAT